MLKKTNFKNLHVIHNKKYRDKRGYLFELLKSNKIKKNFPFIICSHSRKNVLRGLHIQIKKPQGKYISVLKGKIFDVALDLRKNSKTFGKFFNIILSEKNCKSLFIPEGFAHGFCSLSNDTLVLYACTKYRSVKNELSIKYNDKDLKIKWPTIKPIVSKKDLKSITYKEFLKKYILKK